MPPDQQDDEVEQILADLEKPSEERAMTSPEAQEPPPAEPPAWNGEEWAFETGGKRIIPDSREKITQWMSQGYNYAQRAGELNKQRAEWEKKLADYEGKLKGYSRYDEINAYAAQNPEWWQHVESQWNSRQQPQVDPALAQIIDPLRQELGSIKEVVGQWQQAQAAERDKAQDTALEQEIGKIRAEYPNIDLASTDETGKPLELRVLEHAKELGTTSFRAAFRDYLHDKLVTMSSAKAKEAEVRQRAEQTRRGIIAQSATPTKKADIADYKRGDTYDSLTRDALRELGITA